MKHLVFFALCLGLFSEGYPSFPVKYGLDLVTHPFSLPLLRDHETTFQVSSHDKTGGNEDGGYFDVGLESYLYKDQNNEYVLVDEMGSGYIARMWFTKLPDCNIRIYIDGETDPLIDTPIEQFFQGDIYPFLYPLTGDELVSSGGYISYIPVFFMNRIKITLTTPPYYYNITYKKLSNYKIANSFIDSENIDKVTTLLQDGPEQVLKAYMPDTLSTSVYLPPSHSDTLFLWGSHTITQLNIKLNGSGDFMSLADDLWLYARWDHNNQFDIKSPFTLFFGGGIDNFSCQSYLMGSNPFSRQMYSFFPMPFHEHAVLIIENKSDQSADLDICLTTTPSLPANNTRPFGYFRTSYQKIIPKTGKDMLLFEKHGQGHIVGTVLDIEGGLRPSHLEGDEIIYIDDSNSPQIYGTGTEDFFNGGWYFKNGLFSLPFHGFTYGDIYSDTRQICYRYFLFDNINFNRHIEFYMEHGPDNDVHAEYQSLVLFYHSDNINLHPADSLDIGNPEDERMHHYESDANAQNLSKTFFYEGIHDETFVKDNGESLTNCNFTLSVNPNNNGVRLVRRLNYGAKNQKAGVYVDNVYAGEWYNPGWNIDKQWLDSFFEIPSHLTAGKSTLSISIAAESDKKWNSFRYWAYAYITDKFPVIQTHHPELSTFLSTEQYKLLPVYINNTGEATLEVHCIPNDTADIKTVLVTGWGDSNAQPFHDAFLSPWANRDFEITTSADIPVSVSQYSQIVLLGSGQSKSNINPDSLDAFIHKGGAAFVFASSYSHGLLPVELQSSAVSNFSTRQYLIDATKTIPHDITNNIPEAVPFRGWAESVTAAQDARVLMNWKTGEPFLILKNYGNGYMIYISQENAWNSATWYGDQETGLQLCSQILQWLEEEAHIEWFDISPRHLSLEPGKSGEFTMTVNPFIEEIPPNSYSREITLFHNDPFVENPSFEITAHFGTPIFAVVPPDNNGYYSFDNTSFNILYSSRKQVSMHLTYFPNVSFPFIKNDMASRCWDISADMQVPFKPVIQITDKEQKEFADRLSDLKLATFLNDEWVGIQTRVDTGALTLTSEVNLNGSNRIGYGILDADIVPVELTNFSAKVIEPDSVLLTWQTVSEHLNLGFEIQRALSEKIFYKIAFIPGQGTSNKTHNYFYYDYIPNQQEATYRLKQIDTDANIHYSETLSISFPHRYELNPAFPNPFNHTSTIIYSVGEESHVKIDIYDIRGNLIDRLVDDKKSAGWHNVRWNAVDKRNVPVASGVYFIKLKHQNGNKIQKITFVK